MLWTNPSPTASFASQTVNLSDNITNYKMLKFTFRHSNTVSDEVSVITEINDLKQYGSAVGKNCTAGVSRTAYGFMSRRLYYVSDTSVSFANAMQINGSNQNNTDCIPIKVTGLK